MGWGVGWERRGMGVLGDYYQLSLNSACWGCVGEGGGGVVILEEGFYHGESMTGTVADPGFSPEGFANSQKCYYFSNICRKLYENERIWTLGGPASLAPPP